MNYLLAMLFGAFNKLQLHKDAVSGYYSLADGTRTAEGYWLDIGGYHIVVAKLEQD